MLNVRRTLACLAAGAMSLLWTASFAQHALEPCVAANAGYAGLAGLEYRCVRLKSGPVLVAQSMEASKPAVVLVHGLGNNAHRDWRRVYPALTDRFRVVMLDLPGFGDSGALNAGYSFDGLAAALEELAQQLDLQRFDLVGHSLGAAVSLHYTDRYPARVRRLVLVDAAGMLQKQVFVRQLLEANRSTTLGGLDNVMDLMGPGAGDTWLDLLEDRLDAGAQLLAIPAVRSAVLGMPVHADAALGLVEHDFTMAIRSVRAPTFLIWGEGDNVTPMRTGKLLAARMPNARLQVIEGAQHMPMVERPESFNRVLLDALQGDWPAPQPPVRSHSQGEVSCRDQAGVLYSGTYERITLTNCTNVRIERAFVDQLVVEAGSVELVQVAIHSDALALQVTNASVVGTGMTIVGDVALRARDSRVDLAGVTLRARKQAVESTGSRVYFSVSDIDAPDYRGDAHFRWPPKSAIN